jgi:hypothetical protein
MSKEDFFKCLGLTKNSNSNTDGQDSAANVQLVRPNISARTITKTSEHTVDSHAKEKGCSIQSVEISTGQQIDHVSLETEKDETVAAGSNTTGENSLNLKKSDFSSHATLTNTENVGMVGQASKQSKDTFDHQKGTFNYTKII